MLSRPLSTGPHPASAKAGNPAPPGSSVRGQAEHRLLFVHGALTRARRFQNSGWARDHAGQLPAVGRGLEEQAERHVGHVNERLALHLPRDGQPGGVVRGGQPGGAELLQARS